MPPQKRARGGKAREISKATRTVTRTGHKPVARIPQTWIIDEPKEAGSGAERLATPNPQEIHHRPMLGPSFQQGWGGEPAEEQPTLVEGSVEVEAVHINSTEQQQQQQQKPRAKRFPFPEKFEPVHRALLASTPRDWLAGGVDQIKCKLCPDAEVNGWEGFKRHCCAAEAHPSRILFCNRCGDFFARTDSLGRHCGNRPPECRRFTPERLEEASKKREETQRCHKEFMERLMRFATTGEDIGTPFCSIIKEMYPGSSKKRIMRNAVDLEDTE
jgi:hypothetical protein